MSEKILQTSLSSTDTRILKLYNQIKSGELILRPFFQRKLVWKKNHKYHFIETILKNYPFPEIYISTGSMDTKSLSSTDWVVDGQQRLSTIYDYISNEGDFKNQKNITPFNELSEEEQEDFLSYKVVVRDLGNISINTIQEIFKRINNTEYSLNTNEKMNASYHNNSFMVFCKQLIDTELEFDTPYITENNIYIISREEREKISSLFRYVFTDNDIRRMNDLQYMMILITSLEIGYFHRRTEVNKFLERYNEEYQNARAVKEHLLDIVFFISHLDFDKKSYWYNKANMFTLVIELSKLNLSEINVEFAKNELNLFDDLNKQYNIQGRIDSSNKYDYVKYFIHAKEAVNDKKSRLIRGDIVQEILTNCVI